MEDGERQLADAGIVVLADEKEMASLYRVDVKDQLEMLCLIEDVLYSLDDYQASLEDTVYEAVAIKA